MRVFSASWCEPEPVVWLLGFVFHTVTKLSCFMITMQNCGFSFSWVEVRALITLFEFSFLSVLLQETWSQLSHDNCWSLLFSGLSSSATLFESLVLHSQSRASLRCSSPQASTRTQAAWQLPERLTAVSRWRLVRMTLVCMKLMRADDQTTGKSHMLRLPTMHWKQETPERMTWPHFSETQTVVLEKQHSCGEEEWNLVTSCLTFLSFSVQSGEKNGANGGR